MKPIKLKLILLLMMSTLGAFAQQKLQKFSKTVNANKDVTINLNTSHTNIEVDTWNKDKIEIEAYIEGEKLSKEALEKELKNWNVSINGSGKEVTIESKGNQNSWSQDMDFDRESMEALKHLEFELAEMPELPEMPEMPEMENFPNTSNMPQLPNLPTLPNLPQGIGAVDFDYEAYKKDGEKYLDKWSKEYEAKYGKEYRDQMKTWAREFGKIDFETYSKKMEKWGEEFGEKYGKEYGKKMEAWGKEFEEKWGKDYEKKMEDWGEKFGENFGKQMEERAKVMEMRSKENAKRAEAMQERSQNDQERMAGHQERVQQRQAEIERSIENKIGSKVKKTIRIKMPKKAKLKMNVRHGEMKFTSVIYNLRGDVSHSALIANSIDGSNTSINASYSPVLITNWIMGELKLNYVDKAQIENVNRLVLNANSSNIDINSLSGNAVIDGSFGELAIHKIMDTFNNLNLVLENSEALVVLPNIAYNLQYKGSRSRLKHPQKKGNEMMTSYSVGDLNSNKTIVINAKFSEVTMK